MFVPDSTLQLAQQPDLQQHECEGRALPAQLVNPPAARMSRGRKSKKLATVKFKPAEEIARLELLVAQRRQQVEVLWEQRHLLSAKARAAQWAVDQCLALLQLGAMVQRRSAAASSHNSSCTSCSGASGSCCWDMGGASATAAVAEWDEHLAQMRQQLGASTSPQCCTASNNSFDDQALGWSPTTAAASAATADLSTQGLRNAIREFVRKTGPLYL